jgi:hypothetical protein
LTWDQGFVAISGRLIEATGLSDSAADHVMRVTLSHVTASMDEGLFRLDMREGTPVMPEVSLDFTNCVFVHDSYEPLVEFLEVQDLTQTLDAFVLQGKDNLYDFTEVRLRVVPTGGQPSEYRWGDQPHPWYEERRAERGLRWKEPLPIEKEIDTRIPRDYRLEASESRVAGFDEQQLPVPPDPALTDLP